MNKTARIFSALGFGSALVFVLSAHKCETVFPPFEEEINCTDGQDNDSDGVADCADPDCKMSCSVTLTLNPVDSVTYDTMMALTGTQQNATDLTILNLNPASATFKLTGQLGASWEIVLHNVTARNVLYSGVVRASNKAGQSDTASFSFYKR